MALKICPVCGSSAVDLWDILFSGENVCADCFDHFNYRMGFYLGGDNAE